MLPKQTTASPSTPLEKVGDGLGAMRRAVILADAGGRISWLSELARAWLTEFFPEFLESTGELPLKLKMWLEQSKRFASAVRPSLTQLQTHAVAGFRLIVYCANTKDGSLVIAMVRERLGIEPATARALGLTKREGQVLFWISEAKTNPQIAAILGISTRTIHKHTERIFAKLGLENRLEAQRFAWELRRI
ncbi:MAG: helix-turn-helix transcriptional regulator [Verrucomicrobiota bacterium]|jgi:DNA-binding CsgD family transcriptional regulator